MNSNESKTPSPDAPPFEFGPEYAGLIADLGAKMRFVGLLVVVLGAVSLLAGLARLPSDGLTGGAIVSALSALFLAAIGGWSIRAGREFLLVARTEGADIPHLIRALENLQRLYGFQYHLAWAGLLLLVAAIIFGVFVDQAH